MPNIIKTKPKSTAKKKKTTSAKTKPSKANKPSLSVGKQVRSAKQNSLTLVKKVPRSKSSTPDYYQCLLNYAQAGFYDN
jgi:hypothetical protein